MAPSDTAASSRRRFGVVGTVATIIGALALWNKRHSDDLSRERASEGRRQLRMLLALRAELILNLDPQARTFTGDTGAAFRSLYDAAIDDATTAQGKATWPRVIVSATNDVYDQLKSALPDLPASVLPEVIDYYQNDEYVVQVLKAYNDGRLDGVSTDRQRAAVTQLFRIGHTTTIAAHDAVTAISAAIADHSARRDFDAMDLHLPTRLQATMDRLAAIVETMRHELMADLTGEKA